MTHIATEIVVFGYGSEASFVSCPPVVFRSFVPTPMDTLDWKKVEMVNLFKAVPPELVHTIQNQSISKVSISCCSWNINTCQQRILTPLLDPHTTDPPRNTRIDCIIAPSARLRNIKRCSIPCPAATRLQTIAAPGDRDHVPIHGQVVLLGFCAFIGWRICEV